MPAFAYTALTSNGRQIKGVQNAETVGALKAALKREGVFLTSAVESANAASGGGTEIDLSRFFDRIRPKAVSQVTRLLSTLLIAGVTLPESLVALTEQVPSPRFKGVLSDLSARVNEGSSLADAMSKHPDVFDTLYVNMIRAGEASGSLDTVLVRLADFIDQQEELRGKVQTAMIYPLAMGVVGMFVVGILVVRVVPQIAQMFEDQNAQLPMSTQFLMWLSALIMNWWWALGAGVAGALWLFRTWKASPGGRLIWDTGILKLPVVGDLARKLAIARFARTLSTMLSSGVQLLEALDITRSLLGNVVLEDVVRQARDNIREGAGISPALKKSGHFPPLVTHMIAVGERSGQLEQMLSELAEAYDREVSGAIARSTALLEPIMIVVMGGVVGFIVFSIMTPILQMNQMAGK